MVRLKVCLPNEVINWSPVVGNQVFRRITTTILASKMHRHGKCEDVLHRQKNEQVWLQSVECFSGSPALVWRFFFTSTSVRLLLLPQLAGGHSPNRVEKVIHIQYRTLLGRFNTDFGDCTDEHNFIEHRLCCPWYSESQPSNCCCCHHPASHSLPSYSIVIDASNTHTHSPALQLKS